MKNLNACFARTACLLVRIGLVFALASLTGCHYLDTPEKLLSKAQKDVANGNFVAAIIELKDLLQRSPDESRARYMLGVAFLETAQPKLAEAEFRRCLELGFDAEQARSKLAKSLLMQGKFSQVLEETDGTRLPNAERMFQILTLRGLAELASGRLDTASQLFDRSLALSPDYPDAILGLARVAMARHDIKETDRLIARAISSSPNDVEAWLLKGDLAWALEDDDGALSAYYKVLELRADYTSARQNITYLQIKKRDYAEAKKQLAIIRKSPTNNFLSLYLQALLDFRLNNFKAALENVQRVLKLLPDYTPALQLAASAEYLVGSPQQALFYIRTILDKDPNNLEARKLQITLLLKTGQTAQAVEAVQAAINQAPESAAVMGLAGEVYTQANELEKATRYFEKAAALGPKDAQLRTALAVSRLATGDTNRGLADLQSAVQLDSQNYRPDILLVLQQMQRGDFDEALKAVAGLEQKQPQNPITYNLKGAVYLGKKDRANARLNLEHALKLQPDYVVAAANLARLDVEDGNPSAARHRFEDILNKDKNNIAALVALADFGGSFGATQKERIDWLERARALNPSSLELGVKLAGLQAEFGDYKKALEIAQTMQAANPENVQALDLLGGAQLAAGQLRQALDTFNKLVALLPASPGALYRLAGAQARNGDRNAAMLSLNKALSLDPKFTDAQVALFDLALQAGKFEEALKIAREVQKSRAKAATGYDLEGDAWMVQAKYDRAVLAYRSAYDTSQTPVVAMKLHRAYTLAGKAADAEKTLSQALTQFGNDIELQMYAAATEMVKNKFKEAIARYEAIVVRQPKNFLALNNLAWCYQQTKDPRAKPTAEQAYQLSRGNGTIADTYGWILFETGDTAQGVSILEEAVSAAPQSIEIRYHLAQALAKAGDKAGAITQLERVLSVGAKFSQQGEAQALLRQLEG